MTRVIRSRRAGLVRDPSRQLPLYARMLRLRHLAPSGFLCFVFFEGAVALGLLLALAELVSWWGVVVLPLTVAAMVKLNDVVAGAVGVAAVAATASPGAAVPPVSMPRRAAPQARAAGGSTGGSRPPGTWSAPVPPAVSSPAATVAGPAAGEPHAGPPVQSADASALNGPPAARQWSNPEERGNPRRWARQAASRRYR